MANQLMPKYKEHLLQELLTSVVKLVLIDTNDYSFNAAHEFLDDIPGAARVSTTAALTGKSVTNGVFAASNTFFPNATGDQSEAVAMFIDTGVESTSRIVAWLDTATGLATTPDGTNINVIWGASIFSL